MRWRWPAGILLFLTSSACGAAAQTRDAAVLALPGLIVDERSLARRADVPGVRATSHIDAAEAARLEALTAARDAAAVSAPGAAFSDIAPLPGDAADPPRVDSGDPDPDRLSTAPPPQ
jgi:hypothetical protein